MGNAAIGSRTFEPQRHALASATAPRREFSNKPISKANPPLKRAGGPSSASSVGPIVSPHSHHHSTVAGADGMERLTPAASPGRAIQSLSRHRSRTPRRLAGPPPGRPHASRSWAGRRNEACRPAPVPWRPLARNGTAPPRPDAVQSSRWPQSSLMLRRGPRSREGQNPGRPGSPAQLRPSFGLWDSRAGTASGGAPSPRSRSGGPAP